MDELSGHRCSVLEQLRAHFDQHKHHKQQQAPPSPPQLDGIDGSKKSVVENGVSVEPTTTTTNRSLGGGDDLAEFVKHPLVLKTLLETYGVSSLDELNHNNHQYHHSPVASSSSSAATAAANRHFFICTCCGYRGNTARGVKQHGKLHLLGAEQFAIINASGKYPAIIYNSKSENPGVANFASVASSPPPAPSALSLPLVVASKRKRRTISDEDDDDDDAGDSKEAKTNDILDREDKKAPSRPATAAESADNYCFKCHIQFQHAHSFLAHKKLYCKDN